MTRTDLFQLSANKSCEALVGLVWPLLVESLDVGCAVVVWIDRATGMEEGKKFRVVGFFPVGRLVSCRLSPFCGWHGEL